MKHPPPFPRTDCLLRPLALSDAGQVFIWRNSPPIYENGSGKDIVTREEHQGWMERVISTPEHYDYRVFELHGRPLGLVGFFDFQPLHGRCYWMFYIGETDDVPKGTGSVMESLALDYIFFERGVRKLCCEVLGFNEKVITMHERFGFQVEARLRQHCLKRGQAHDVIGMGMLREEWEAKRPAMHVYADDSA